LSGAQSSIAHRAAVGMPARRWADWHPFSLARCGWLDEVMLAHDNVEMNSDRRPTSSHTIGGSSGARDTVSNPRSSLTSVKDVPVRGHTRPATPIVLPAGAPEQGGADHGARGGGGPGSHRPKEEVR
jgi:hypothetical protein